jgi:tRNA A64-2'-O-ribosylphosphate transferase
MDRIGNLNLWIGSRRAGRPPTCWTRFEAILNVTNVEYPDMNITSPHYAYLQLSVAEGKRDRTELERWMPVGLVFLIQQLQQGHRVLVHCAQGKDRSVALVLALVVLSCRLVFPLRLQTGFDQWDLKRLCQQVVQTTNRPPNDSNTNGDDDYLQSGLSQSLVAGLVRENGRELFLEWVHSQLQRAVNEPLANKESLRIALHLIRQDRDVADPTRATLQKLNRFFMSSPLYRQTVNDQEQV